MSTAFNKGDAIRIAQDTIICEYSKKEKTLYYKDRLSKSSLAIYLRRFSEYNDYLCEVILEDKIVYIPERDIREILDDKNNKICFYRGTRSDI